jgi:hypothetical protein
VHIDAYKIHGAAGGAILKNSLQVTVKKNINMGVLITTAQVYCTRKNI